MAQRAARPAALDAQLADGSALPEELRVRRVRRPHDKSGGFRGVVPPGKRIQVRAELQHPPVHRRHRLVAGVPDVPGRNEPALAEGRPLGAGHVGQLGSQREQLAVPQIAVVGLIAVRGHHGGEPGRVERGHHLAQRVGSAVTRRGLQPRHGPDLDHCRRRDQSAVRGSGRVTGVGVQRAGVADRVSPVADRRHVHRIPRQPRGALALGSDRASGCPYRLADRVLPRVPPLCWLIWAPAEAAVRPSQSAHAAPR